jgi:2-(1,2-epoxy-1,2-dihydrophenyl)acetyl-CoA isomerase
MSQFETVDYQVEGRVATIALNRPKVRNSFNVALRRDLLQAAAHANADNDIRVVILTGNGKSFCAGADLTDPLPDNFLVQAQIDDEYKPVLMAIYQSPKPYISAVNGAAAGAGGGFAMVCDLTIMGEQAYYYQAFGAIGLIPDCGVSWQLVQQLGKKRVFDLIVSGEKLPAARCVELGLANRVVPDDQLREQALAWALELSDKAPLAMRYSKQALAYAQNASLSDTVSYEAKLQNLAYRSRDFHEGVSAFLEKRPAKFIGD